MRNLLAPVVLVAAAVPGVAAQQQSEIDRVLWNFNGTIITTSDVWQARQLKLVDRRGYRRQGPARAAEPSTDSDGGQARPTRRSRPPTTSNPRRREWEATLGHGADVRTLLTKAGMSEKACDTWITDDLRIRAYLRERFGMFPEAERGARTDEWLRGLRQRAGLGSSGRFRLQHPRFGRACRVWRTHLQNPESVVAGMRRVGANT